jgi:hypothetical protein
MPSAALTDVLSKRQLELATMADTPLVEGVYELVRQLDDRLSDEFYWWLTEAFERFAPNVELNIQRCAVPEGEFEQYLEGCGARHAARLAARAERQQQKDWGDA